MISNDKKDITIVIITYNRYQYLLRLLKFYENYKNSFQFLILDSSSHEATKHIKYFLKKDNIDYKKYDSTIFFSDKISDGCKYIKTPFAVLCPDDDFLIPSSIIEAKNYLHANLDYSSAHGIHFAHTQNSEISKKGFSINPIYKFGNSSELDSSADRLKGYFMGKSGYYPMYAVHRTDLFKKIWTETKEYISDWGLSELFPCALSFIYGKMKILPLFYASREPNTFNWINKKRQKGMYNKEKTNRAIEGLTRHLSTFQNINLIDARKIVSKAFRHYLNNLDKKEKSQLNFKNSIFKKFKQKIRIRARLQSFFLKGCHISVYKKSFNDFSNVREAVILSNIPDNVLNSSRKEY